MASSLQVIKHFAVGEAGRLSVPEASMSLIAALLVGSGEVRDTALFCLRPLHKMLHKPRGPPLPARWNCYPPLYLSAGGFAPFFCETGQIVFAPAAQVGRLDFQSLERFEALDEPLCSRFIYEELPEIVTLVSSNNGAPLHLSASRSRKVCSTEQPPCLTTDRSFQARSSGC